MKIAKAEKASAIPAMIQMRKPCKQLTDAIFVVYN